MENYQCVIISRILGVSRELRIGNSNIGGQKNLGQGCGLELVCHDDDFINATTKFCSRASMWQEERINNTSSHPDLPTNSEQRQRMTVYPLENLCSEPLWNWRWRSFCLFLILDFWLKLLNWYQRTGKCLIRELKTH